MNRSRVKRFAGIFRLFFSSDTPLFFLLAKSRVLLGPAAAREWPTNEHVAVLATAAEQDAAVVRKHINANAANQTECVFQTPIRADHKGRYIRLTTGRAPILSDVMPFGSTLHDDRDDRRFAAFVFFFMPLSPILYNV